ncbi:hypothetical protein EBQ74_11265 [bacterium]|nr:hypothetical protein [bacterium]
MEFHGVLYIGIMISPEGNPYVLEFNTRFGDPETQSLMMRIESDLLPALVATAKGKLNSTPRLRGKKKLQSTSSLQAQVIQKNRSWENPSRVSILRLEKLNCFLRV